MTNLIVAGIFGVLAAVFGAWAWRVQQRGGPGAEVARRTRLRVAVIFAVLALLQIVLHVWAF